MPVRAWRFESSLAHRQDKERHPISGVFLCLQVHLSCYTYTHMNPSSLARKRLVIAVLVTAAVLALFWFLAPRTGVEAPSFDSQLASSSSSGKIASGIEVKKFHDA